MSRGPDFLASTLLLSVMSRVLDSQAAAPEVLVVSRGLNSLPADL